MTLDDLRGAILETYGIEEEIAKRLVLKYYSQSNPNDESTRKAKYIDNEDAIISHDDLLFKEHTLVVRYEKGDTREEDCSCDSEFMNRTMGEVGQAIRERYRANGVSDDTMIYLVMDNAGGHGTSDCWDWYVSHLRDVYNIKIIRQQPRTPESNMLDLGVWMHVQFKVEETHFGMRSEVNALWRTMEAAWHCLSQQALTNVYQRWLKVLDLTIKADGSNRLVETERGRLYTVPSSEAESFDDVEGEVDEDADGGEDADI